MNQLPWIFLFFTLGCSSGGESTVTKKTEIKKETRYCCMALTATCLACGAGQTVEEFCAKKPKTPGCGSTK